MNKFPRLSYQIIIQWTMARVCGILIIVWLFFSVFQCLLFFVPSSFKELRRKKSSQKVCLLVITSLQLQELTWKCTLSQQHKMHFLHEVSYIASIDLLMINCYEKVTIIILCFFTFLANIMIKRTNIWYVIFSLLNTNCILYNGVDAHEVAVPFAITKMHRLTMVQLI